MKELYKSPVITVEDLTKTDVLCASTEKTDINNPAAFNRKVDNINQLARTLGDMSNLL
ncbi:MAG: hypothetical protein IIU39_06990 [Ruminococcus sp.]|nr:hypothetical protein [Ruminococcus sp.]